MQGDICDIEILVEPPFGGALCLGNTLPHVRETEQLERLFSGLRSRLESGAPLIIQLLNYERIFQRGERYLPLNFRSDGEEEIVFLRLMELEEDDGVRFYPSTLRLRPGEDPPLEVKAAKEVRLRGWRAQTLERALARAGFEAIERLGDFEGRTLRSRDSTDLILVAR